MLPKSSSLNEWTVPQMKKSFESCFPRGDKPLIFGQTGSIQTHFHPGTFCLLGSPRNLLPLLQTQALLDVPFLVEGFKRMLADAEWLEIFI